MSPNPYTTLGVAPTATAVEIKKAFRKLAKEYHPDAHPGDAKAEAKFKAISGAWEVLGDPDKRKLYDEFGEESTHSGFDAARARQHRDWASAQGGGFRGGGGFSGGGFPGAGAGFDFNDILSQMSGQGGRGQRRRASGADFLARVNVSFLDAIKGTELTFNLPLPDAPSVTVRLPAGAQDGDRLKVAGQGAPGPSGERGNLVIEVHVQPHTFFRREGLDLSLDVPLTIAEAYLGADIEVPTPGGRVRVHVPPQTVSGAKLRLKGKGVRRQQATGDLFVHLQVQMPDVGDSAFAAAAAAATYAKPLREGLVV